MNPAELSAFLDGELQPERARAVEAMLAADPGLRAELDALRRSDAAFRAAAQTAAFRPTVDLRARDVDAHSLLVAAGLALVVALARIAPHVPDGLAFGLLVHGAALAVILSGITWIVRQDRSAA